MPGTLETSEIKIWVDRPSVPMVDEVKPPKDSPRLSVTGICFGGHTLRICSERRDQAWPKDADRLELFVAVSNERESAPLSKAVYWRSFMEETVNVRFDQDADGMTATYFGRWANERGDVGPWSASVSKTIAG